MMHLKPLQSLKALASPPRFMDVALAAQRVLLPLGCLFLMLGLCLGLVVAPTDLQQGEVYRIIYMHVPAAWMSMLLYCVACGYAMLNWIYRNQVSAVMMHAFLPTGAWMTALALVTGALWGKPTWGTYWVWDARMTSELLLLFIYLGLMATTQLTQDPSKVDRLLAVGLLIGLVNIPLIYFSVVFLNTLHQGYSVKLSGQSLHIDMARALWLSVLGFWLLCAAVVLRRAKGLLVQRRVSRPDVAERLM